MKAKRYSREQIAALGPTIGDETPAATVKRLLREARSKVHAAARIVECGLTPQSDVQAKLCMAIDIASEPLRPKIDHQALREHMKKHPLFPKDAPRGRYGGLG